jgi:hypothetical protein
MFIKLKCLKQSAKQFFIMTFLRPGDFTISTKAALAVFFPDFPLQVNPGCLV